MKFLPFLSCALLALHVQAAPDPVQALLTEAQVAHARGDLELAKAKYQSVLQMDRKNITATAYLKRIQVEEAKGGKGGGQEKQLARLIVPAVQFRDAELSAALDYLKQTASKLSEGKQAVNFVVQVPEAQAKTPITLNLTNVPFTEVLRYVGDLASVSFSFDPYAITVRPKAGATAAATSEPAAK
ncbi:MAG TPA: hypothetical protein VGO90_07865 [Chthoniobacteraceae bacterium]|jgi:tetratricopeptide (TPR) repeat protein|nr:hypothetical protein [Chthoniobacteraceae bacterium]